MSFSSDLKMGPLNWYPMPPLNFFTTEGDFFVMASFRREFLVQRHFHRKKLGKGIFSGRCFSRYLTKFQENCDMYFFILRTILCCLKVQMYFTNLPFCQFHGRWWQMSIILFFMLPYYNQVSKMNMYRLCSPVGSRPSTNETPPIGKIHPSCKVA